MASRRPTKRQKNTGNALDMSNYLNWPASLLREKLTGANINTSLSFPISVLRKLYVDNVLNTEATARSTASEVVDGNNVIGGNTANDSPDIAVSSHPAKETDNSHSVPISHTELSVLAALNLCKRLNFTRFL